MIGSLGPRSELRGLCVSSERIRASQNGARHDPSDSGVITLTKQPHTRRNYSVRERRMTLPSRISIVPMS